MDNRLLLGFASAQELWRFVGERVAQRNAPSSTQRPLLIRILFERGAGIDLTDVPFRTRLTKVPGTVDAGLVETAIEHLPPLASCMDLCVSRQRGRRSFQGATCHLMSGSYPEGSFCQLDEGVLVTGPELTFLQMARVLDDDLLVAYGYEICGYFARTSAEHGFCNCPALTSTSKIKDYLDRLARLRGNRGEGMPWGYARALRALRYVRDGAASPEEAVTSMVLTLPGARGGYGLPPARLNAAVRLSAAAAELFGIEEFVCDMSWDGHGLVAEFQGGQHKQRTRRSYDSRKGNVLGADGWTIVEVDRGMLERASLMDEVAKSISAGLGIRWRQPGASRATRQLRLRNKLLRYLDER